MKQGFFYVLTITMLSALLGCTSENTSTSTSNNTVQPITESALIARDILFGNPSRFQGRLSPDATLMSFRAPVNGVMNVWVGKRGDFDSAKPITHDTGRGVPRHFWALDSQHVLYTQDQNGDENWHLFRIDLASGDILDLTPFEGVQANVMGQSEDMPGIVIVGMNDRDPKWHDVYSVELATGKRTLLEKNDGYGNFVLDNNLQVRLANKTAADGSSEVFVKSNDEWALWFSIPFEDVQTSNILAFDSKNQGVFILDSRNRNTAALVHLELGQQTPNIIAADDKVDIANVLIDPRSHQPFAYALEQIKPVWHAINEEFTLPIQQLNNQLSGGSQILAQSLDNKFWTVYTDNSDRSPIYKVFDANTGELNELFVTQPEINDLALSKMHGVIIPSRDNLELVSYLSLPLESDANQDGKAERPSPLVMLVHGGPWARDSFGYNSLVQWLTNRGYAVLQVNFRSSTGFGKDFLNAGNKEWAGAMHNDLMDAKKWAVEQGIAKNDQVAMMGASYGGYATLVALTFTPEAFSCGVDIVGPSNLVTLIESIPPYWESFRKVAYQSIGNPDTAEGLAMLKERSPVNHVDKIVRPLLIGQGANDPRVKQAESDQIVDAMKARDIPVTYVLYPDEGHGFQKPENNLSFFAVAEAFLGSCLGGRVQPVGDDFNNSSIEIIYGLNYLPSLQTQLQQATAQ